MTRRHHREQQVWNRLAHSRWPERETLSWPWAIAIAGLALVVLFGQFGP